jgi:hypothetical protein
MSDRAYFSVLGLAAAAMIALALVWPQGMGARSPGPFGHAVTHPAKTRASGPSPSLLPIPTAPVIPAEPGVVQAPADLPAESQ